ncbi:MAG: fasciclin domain-containing protein [Porticoccaceae bacterium]|nr:fasciclin domain-containing protein [Porticoccaceae bacterium]
MKKLKLLSITVVVLLFLQACGSSNTSIHEPDTPIDTTPEPTATTIVDVAVADGNFTTLVAALQATGLDATLSDTSESYTVFAPTDDAFALLGQETIDGLLNDLDTLTDILTYHVISGEVDAAAAIASVGNLVEMVSGDKVGLSLDGENLLVNVATVTVTDIQADNGIIHVIDAVLMPLAERAEPTMNIVDTAIAADSFDTLISVLQATGLDSALADESRSFTVFAPTDEAFAMISAETIAALLANPDVLTDILLQHVVEAEVLSTTAFSLNGQSASTLSEAAIPVSINSALNSLLFGGATVTVKDIYATNGVIHVIDMVVIADVELPDPAMSIVDVAMANGNFTSLVAALQATGLDTVLDDPESNFTVFAPSDDAFALLGQETIDALFANTVTLSGILLNHVLPDVIVLQDTAVMIAQSANKMVTTAVNQDVSLSLSDGTLYANKSAVSLTDIAADNGVIHVIDQVILPLATKLTPTTSIVDVATSDPRFSTLVDALTAADLVSTLADENATFTVFAPTNEAFAKIESTALSDLLADTTALNNVLLNHVVSGAEINALNAFAANGTDVGTASGDNVSVKLVNFTQTTNAANDEVAYNSEMEMLVGGNNSAQPGFTLYVFDEDLGTSGSACNSVCTAAWPPVLVTDAEVSNIPGLSIINRDDNSKQAAYLGRPLYFFQSDSAPGDNNGDGVGGAWWSVDQEQVSLQVQGSNVITTDIYTSNGVIHVIDTVITDNLIPRPL